jgi:hypothetical protein
MPIDPLHRGGDLAACDLAGTPAQRIKPREMAASIAWHLYREPHSCLVQGRRRRCSASPRHLGAITAHSSGVGGSGLVQHVFRSPARIQFWSPAKQNRAPRRQAKNALHYHVPT